MSTGSAMIVSAACIHSTFRAWMYALDAGTIRKRQDASFIDALATAAVGFVKVQQAVYEFQVRNGTEEDQADIKALFRNAEQMIEDARPYLKKSVRTAAGSSFTLRDILIYQSGGPDPEAESGGYAGTLDEDGGDRWFEDTILGRAWTDAVQKVSASTPIGSAAIAELEHLPGMKPISIHSSLIGAVMDCLPEIATEAMADKEEGPIQKRPRTPVAVSKRGKPLVTTNVVIAIDDIPDGMKISGRPFTAFHRSVLDAVNNIFLYGDTDTFTVDQVCRVMNNRTDREDPGSAYTEAVRQAIYDMRHMWVYIDATEEVKMRHLQEVEKSRISKVTYDRQFLDLDGVTVESGGREIQAYKFVRAPAMLEYCKRVNQLTTVPASVLDIRKTDKEGRLTTVSVSTSPRRTVIRDFLMREVQGMKNAGKTKRSGVNVIKLDRIYSTAEVSASDKMTKKRIRSYTEDVMKSWTASGYIKGWNWRKKGNVYEALVIDP